MKKMLMIALIGTFAIGTASAQGGVKEAKEKKEHRRTDHKSTHPHKAPAASKTNTNGTMDKKAQQEKLEQRKVK